MVDRYWLNLLQSAHHAVASISARRNRDFLVAVATTVGLPERRTNPQRVMPRHPRRALASIAAMREGPQAVERSATLLRRLAAHLPSLFARRIWCLLKARLGRSESNLADP